MGLANITLFTIFCCSQSELLSPETKTIGSFQHGEARILERIDHIQSDEKLVSDDENGDEFRQIRSRFVI